MLTLHENGLGTVVQWDEVPGAQYYNLVRGKIRNLHESTDLFHLGPLNCLASATTQTSTVGSEDADVPARGEVFFYLGAYNDGLPSSYGTVSAAKERFAPPGQGSCD